MPLLFVLSIVALYIGAEIALSSAERIGKLLGLSPLVIGLLIVGFGTSLPEFFVSQLACYRGHPEIAMGNIVGSNVANVFLIMAIAGIMVPMHLNRKDIHTQLILHLIVTVLLILVCLPSKYYPLASMVLVTFFLFYLSHTFKSMKKQQKAEGFVKDVDDNDKLEILMFLKLFVGFALLYGGGELLVHSGSGLGRLLGVSEYVISALFVAFGTSFPELITVLVACFKKKDVDLITGNIIGSNIFNIAFVLGSLGVYKFEFSQTFYVESAVLMFASLYLLLFAVKKWSFARTSGIVYIAIYASVVTYWFMG